MKKKPSKDIALVLSSGGARGLAHIGVIQEILSRGYRITSIAGCSMGAFIGGLYAVGNLDKYTDWIVGMDKVDVLKMVDFSLAHKGFIKGERVFDRMRELNIIPEVNIEDLPIPFAAVAADIIHNREQVFRDGGLQQAIRASIGIPLIFTPTPFNGGFLVDGGVLNPLPIRHIVRKPGDFLVAVDLNALIPYRKPEYSPKPIRTRRHSEKLTALFKKWDELFGHRNVETSNETLIRNTNSSVPAEGGAEGTPLEKLGYFELVIRPIQLMQYKLTSYALENDPPDLLIRISKDSSTVFEFYKAEELIAYGRQCCAESLGTEDHAEDHTG
jgi:NTE family protein